MPQELGGPKVIAPLLVGLSVHVVSLNAKYSDTVTKATIAA